MANRWKEVWNNREIDDERLKESDEFTLYKELKRLDGFDVKVENEEAYYRSFYNGICEIYETRLASAKSIYEVGCGSGANLFLFKRRGKLVGGVDYSKQLVRVAKKVTPAEDIIAEEAINISSESKYDVVISDSVFAYFYDEAYGRSVLEKMYDKAVSTIILLEIFDKDKEDECNAYRRASIENYDEKYAGLDKIFYSKQMFIDFAHVHDCTIEFESVKNEYYWNSKYMYNCFITKNVCEYSCAMKSHFQKSGK